MAIMHFIKNIFCWLTSILFHISLFGLIGAICFSILLGTKENLKNEIIASGVYDEFVNSVIQANNTNNNSASGSLPLDDPNIQNIAHSVFSPRNLQIKTESLVDASYSWLNGDSEQLSFSVDFTSEKNSLFDQISTYAANRLEGLPMCTSEELSSNDVFRLECQPQGFYKQIVKNQVLNDLNNSDFLKNPIFTQDSLPKTDNGKTITAQLSFMPIAFSLVSDGILIFSLILLLTSTMYVLSRRPIRKGLRALARDLMGNGAAIIFFIGFYNYILPHLTKSFNLNFINSGSAIANDVSNYFVHRLDILVINIAIQIVAVGFVLYVIERMTRPSNIYRELSKKTGLLSSIDQKVSKNSPAINSKRPPIQSSEPIIKKPKKRVKRTKFEL